MKTYATYKVQSSGYMDTMFLIINIAESIEILSDCIKPDLISTDGEFFIIIVNSENYLHLTDYLKRKQIQLRSSYVEFYEDGIYELIPEAFFDIYGEDSEPSEIEIGCDMREKINLNL